MDVLQLEVEPLSWLYAETAETCSSDKIPLNEEERRLESAEIRRCTEPSRKRFEAVTGLEDFLRTWAEFYKGNIVLPTYFGSFISTAGDNPFADLASARKFYTLTRAGFICVDSQVGGAIVGQKAYIVGFTQKRASLTALLAYANRFLGLICYAINATASNKCRDSMNEQDRDNVDIPIVVTYDIDSKRSDQLTADGKFNGRPFTRISPLRGSEELPTVFSWVSEPVRSRLLEDETWYCFNLVDTDYTRQTFLLDTVYSFVQQNLDQQ